MPGPPIVRPRAPAAVPFWMVPAKVCVKAVLTVSVTAVEALLPFCRTTPPAEMLGSVARPAKVTELPLSVRAPVLPALKLTALTPEARAAELPSINVPALPMLTGPLKLLLPESTSKPLPVLFSPALLVLLLTRLPEIVA